MKWALSKTPPLLLPPPLVHWVRAFIPHSMLNQLNTDPLNQVNYIQRVWKYSTDSHGFGPGFLWIVTEMHVFFECKCGIKARTNTRGIKYIQLVGSPAGIPLGHVLMLTNTAMYACLQIHVDQISHSTKLGPVDRNLNHWAGRRMLSILFFRTAIAGLYKDAHSWRWWKVRLSWLITDGSLAIHDLPCPYDIELLYWGPLNRLKTSHVSTLPWLGNMS